MAVELRPLIQLEENSDALKHLYRSIHQPNKQTQEHLKKITQVFRTARRAFDRIGTKACRSKESYDILARYFEAGEEALKAFDDFFDGKNGLSPFADSFSLEREISPADIYHYVYAVLHNPAYRAKYQINLEQAFPRVPFYKNFWQWVQWGEQLMQIHCAPDALDPWKLDISQSVSEEIKEKFSVKINRAEGSLTLHDHDQRVVIQGLPPALWAYQLGSKSALEWVLDQFKEKKSSDNLPDKKFPPPRFRDQVEAALDQIRQIVRLSIETVNLMREMEIEER
ncbi:MAG: hypothetical protein HC880_18250 [Bacteroidia bacterium]|nr:hypothetical protein [Bacteroidia bacterium]